MNNRIEEIKERLKNRTQGEWVSDGRELDQHKPHPETGVVGFYNDCETIIICSDKRPVPNPNDMEFIANAPSDIEFLLNEIERPEKEIEDEPAVKKPYFIIPGFMIFQHRDNSFWFARDDGEGMEVTQDTMEKIFKEHL